MSSPQARTAARVAAPCRVWRCEHVLEAFFVEHPQRFSQTVEQVGRRRVRERSPTCSPSASRPSSSTDFGSVAFALAASAFSETALKPRPGRHHQSLLRAAHGDVDLPLVVAQIDRRQRRNGIDDQQRGMAGAVHRAPKIGDPADDPGRRLVVHDDDRFQLVRRVVVQTLLEGFGRGAAPPRAWHVFDVRGRAARRPAARRCARTSRSRKSECDRRATAC